AQPRLLPCLTGSAECELTVQAGTLVVAGVLDETLVVVAAHLGSEGGGKGRGVETVDVRYARFAPDQAVPDGVEVVPEGGHPSRAGEADGSLVHDGSMIRPPATG